MEALGPEVLAGKNTGNLKPFDFRYQTVTDFIFVGSKITADGDCSHKIRKRLLLRSKDTTLPTKVLLVKAMVFPIVMYDVRGGP